MIINGLFSAKPSGGRSGGKVGLGFNFTTVIGWFRVPLHSTCAERSVVNSTLAVICCEGMRMPSDQLEA